jgi:hypothetical protein
LWPWVLYILASACTGIAGALCIIYAAAIACGY